MSAQEQAVETEILLDSSASVITRIENVLFGPVPATNSATPVGPKNGSLMSLLEDNRVRLNGLVGRLQVIEQALVSPSIKLASTPR